MAFDERLASRVRALLAGRTDVTERRRLGGLTLMVRGHMCCGVNRDELIVRLDPDDEEAALRTPHARPMDFTNRPMTGFVTIEPAGLGEREGRPLNLMRAHPNDSSRRGTGDDVPRCLASMAKI
jgi:hypothetical protein